MQYSISAFKYGKLGFINSKLSVSFAKLRTFIQELPYKVFKEFFRESLLKTLHIAYSNNVSKATRNNALGQ